MNCYECQKSKTAHTGGTHFGVRAAVGVCHVCGVGLCLEHGQKSEGHPFLCSDCAEAEIKRTMNKPAA